MIIIAGAPNQFEKRLIIVIIIRSNGDWFPSRKIGFGVAVEIMPDITMLY
jgi:hypothetical protein